jgi:pSer/pThr/pTyr-binding forkhead associated (FHA) protein
MILEKIEEDIGVMPTIVIITPRVETKIKMGRGHSCDMRINDISVSRVHSII